MTQFWAFFDSGFAIFLWAGVIGALIACYMLAMAVVKAARK